MQKLRSTGYTWVKLAVERKVLVCPKALLREATAPFHLPESMKMPFH